MESVMRRATVLMVAVTISVALVVVANALTPAPADAATRVITRTFSSNGPITIPDVGAATPYPSERTVAGFNRGRVLDVNLSLRSFSHDFPPDVDVLLSRGNMGCTVMSDVGGFPDANNITLLLDDEAADRLPVADQLVSGRFKPTDAEGPDFFFPPVPSRGFPALSGFDGVNPNGTWQLRVVDDDAGVPGRFAGGWSITIKARVQG
jgi:hypothetical protein